MDEISALCFYLQGLGEEIGLQVRLADPTILDEAIVKATIVYNIFHKGRRPPPSTTVNVVNPRSTQEPMAMEPDHVTLGRLTPAERERLRRINGRFRCRRLGHRSSNCKRPEPSSRSRQFNYINAYAPCKRRALQDQHAKFNAWSIYTTNQN